MDINVAPVATGSAPVLPEPYDPIPRLQPWQERLVRVIAVISLAYSTYYVGWRWLFTLNWRHAWFSVPLVVAETYGLIASYIFVFTVWRLTHRKPIPPPDGMDVDVFVTCYDEPLEIVRRTAIGARDILYPHRTYVLDDGKRDEVQAMCQALGIGYVRREGNEHAKAGNLNHALGVTEGAFILQLDADHVPLPHILHRLLGFFEDPKVAFVQSPQDFYNTDSFTHSVDEDRRKQWEEQRIFFSLIQPGKDVWNAAFFCGSCGVVRREALEEIGGFSTLTITEDMETSIILHGRGWKSVYYGESLAYGLAPASATAFHVQRLRWGQGSMQILRRLNPLTYPGLTIGQRLCYFASVTSYLDGVHKMILYASPLLFLLTGIFPIQVSDRDFLIRFIPFLTLSVFTFEMLSRGTGYLWIGERYNMAKFWTYVRAVSGFFASGRLKFNVTPKGAGRVPFSTYAPQVVLIALTIGSMAWAGLASQLGWIVYQPPRWASAALPLNLAWATWNLVLAAHVVRISRQLRQQREEHRFADRFPIRAQVLRRGGRRRRGRVGLAVDLSASGMRFRSAEEFPEDSRLRLTLPLATGHHEVVGRVLHVAEPPRQGPRIFTYGIAFEEVPLNVRDAIELHCTQHAVPIWQQEHRMAADLFARTQTWFRNSRGDRRRRVRLPAIVSIEKGVQGVRGAPERLALLDDFSRSGARLVLDEPVPPGTRIRFTVPGTSLRGHGRVAFSRAMETPVGVRFAVGVRRVTRHPTVTIPSREPVFQRLANHIVGA
jgi:cellulose synthase (UDP-forming)